MSDDAPLLPMKDVFKDPKHNTFIAVDYKGIDGEVHRLVGSFVEWAGAPPEVRMVLSMPESGDTVWIARDIIVAGWWAPSGYRPL